MFLAIMRRLFNQRSSSLLNAKAEQISCGIWKQLRTLFTAHSSPTSLPTIPVVIEEYGRNERAYDIFSRLLKDRIICIMGPISDASASLIIAQLLFLQSDDRRKPIHMYINSPGGVVTAGLGIYDTMQFTSAPVHTWCIGQACSMGSLLLTAGTKGCRHSLPNSRIMIHQPSGMAEGQATDIQIHAEEIVKLKKRLCRIYAFHTGLDLKKIEGLSERDKFLNPHQAKELGLIDTVIENDQSRLDKESDL